MSKEPFHCGLRIAVPRCEKCLLAADLRETHRFKLGERCLVEFWQGRFGCKAFQFVSDVANRGWNVRSLFTWCVLREFCLVGLKARPQVLVKYDYVTLREDDWDVFLAHTNGPLQQQTRPRMLSDTYLV